MQTTDPDDTLDGTFVVVPAYNEGRVLGVVVEGLAAAFPNIVVVNDGSSDDTEAVLAAYRPLSSPTTSTWGKVHRCRPVSRSPSSVARRILTFDADGQHRLEDALRALRVLAGAAAMSSAARGFSEPRATCRDAKAHPQAVVALANLTTGAA